MLDFEPTAETISLHGLGFIQVKFAANQRLHVWYPDLPRRRCFEHSQIHDHRFGFESRVLVGQQVNYTWGAFEVTDGADQHGLGTHTAYRHEGTRSRFGNRPWLPSGLLSTWILDKELVEAGRTYHMCPYVFHSTAPGGDGLVATVMTKVSEGSHGARSLCKVGVEPDVNFDRKQMAPEDMWEAVKEVLCHGD